MRLLVDAQLPVRLAAWLGDVGYDVLHTVSLPEGNRSGSPARLLVVATGNIGNDDLLRLFESRMAEIEEAFDLGDYVELRHGTVVSHSRIES